MKEVKELELQEEWLDRHIREMRAKVIPAIEIVSMIQWQEVAMLDARDLLKAADWERKAIEIHRRVADAPPREKYHSG